MRYCVPGLLAFAVAAQSASIAPPSREGRVIHALTKEPVRGAIVTAAGESSAVPLLADADGSFVLRGSALPSSIVVTKTGHLDARVQVGAGDRHEPLVVELMPAASISGRVLDHAGNPIPEASVRAALKGETLEARARTVTADDRGRYVIDGLEPGEYVIGAGRTSAETMTRPLPRAIVVAVAAGEELDQVDHHVPWDNGQFSARLLKAVQPGSFRAAYEQNGPSRSAGGTGTIAGTVRHRDGGGIANIIVSVWAGAEPASPESNLLSAVTDERGAFAIDRLPAGSYSVMAHRHTSTPSGTTPVSDQYGPVRLSDGERRTDVHLIIRELGSISGTIRDEFGDPVRATVTLVAVSDGLQIMSLGLRKTDDRGRYRIGNLRPGRYVVMASRATTSPVIAGDGTGGMRLVGATPSFYPGVPSVDLAAVISTHSTPHVDAIDLRVAYEPIANVQVVVLTPSAINRIQGRQISRDRSMSTASFESRSGDSAVSFSGVAAGQWRFTLAVMLETPIGRETLWARHDTTTDGLTNQSISTTLEPGARLSGSVVFEGDGKSTAERFADPLGRAPFMLSLVEVGMGPQGMRFSHPTRELAGTFEFRDVLPGTYTIDAAYGVPGSGWRPRSAMLNGEDLLDRPVQLAPAAVVSGVVLTMSTRVTELSGVVADAAGRPVGPIELAIISSDVRYQFPGSRRARRVMTASDGTYTIRGLPPGDYRIGPAPRALTGAAFLQVPHPSPAVTVRLADGERRTLHLTVAR